MCTTLFEWPTLEEGFLEITADGHDFPADFIDAKRSVGCAEFVGPPWNLDHAIVQRWLAAVVPSPVMGLGNSSRV